MDLQFIGSRDGVDAARMERMAARQAAQGEPGAVESAVALDRLESVL
jgi:hypothetical protein